MNAVEIVEVSPRDGLQNESRVLPTATKVALIERCTDAGVRRIEAVSFVHPARVPQMADAEAVMSALPRRAGVSYIGLVLNRRGFDRAVAAGVDEVNVVVSTTETFAERNQGSTVDGLVDSWLDIAAAARDAGLRTSVTVSLAFGCPFEGEVPPERTLEIVSRVAAGEPDEIALADTIGVAVPAAVRELVAGAREVIEQIAPVARLRAHFHDTRSTGIANALAATSVGVDVLDASAGGIGGCPFAPAATGNIATEDLLYALTRSGVETGIDAMSIADIGTWVCGELGKDVVPAMLGRAGWFPPQH
jgi:hydroxymethylglutaryl-CoA lyase